jgi:hypothetical protein
LQSLGLDFKSLNIIHFTQSSSGTSSVDIHPMKAI